MKNTLRALPLACILATGGCATQSAAPPGRQIDGAQLDSRVIPGATTRAQLLEWFGPTTHVRFDSGHESWLYQVPSGSGTFSEFVILLNPQGIVSKTRRRAPEAPPTATR